MNLIVYLTDNINQDYILLWMMILNVQLYHPRAAVVIANN